MNDKNKISTTLTIFGGRIFAVAALVAFAAAGTAHADTITKTFEFGAGAALLRSNVRTFPVPCRKAVAVTVKVHTLGPAGGSNEVPIKIELREPDTAPDQEGPLVEAKNTTARPAEQTITLNGQGNNRGCSLPWRVRVQHANAGTAPFVTLGSIRLDFNIGVGNFAFDGPGGINKNSSKTINLGASGGLEQGKVVLKGDWKHSIVGVYAGPNPIKLKFALIDPNGTVVKTAEGYADRQRERDLGLAILKLVYQVTIYTPGQWKLGITNLDQIDDVSVNVINETFTPGCP